MHCTKISPKFESQGQRSRSPGTKKRKTAESSPLTMNSWVCAVPRLYTASSNRRYHLLYIKRQNTFILKTNESDNYLHNDWGMCWIWVDLTQAIATEMAAENKNKWLKENVQRKVWQILSVLWLTVPRKSLYYDATGKKYQTHTTTGLLVHLTGLHNTKTSSIIWPITESKSP